jgi:hypothetical protein
LSLLLTSCGVAAGLLLGRAVARALRAPRTPDPSNAPARPEDPLADFPCHLGDVLLATNGDEAWLAGALVFREQLPVAALFIAPDAGADRGIFVRSTPPATLLWLAPTAPGTLVIGKEPPASVEHEGVRFERTRRVPYRVERVGTGAPDVGKEVIVAEYSASTGDRLVVITGGTGGERAWRGRVLEEGTYDLLPGSP